MALAELLIRLQLLAFTFSVSMELYLSLGIHLF